MIDMEIDYEENEIQENKAERIEQDKAVLFSAIPSQQWQREKEKVSAKLKIEYKSSNYGMSEWRSHFDQMSNLNNTFAVKIPDTRQILEKVSEDISKSLEKINKKEQMISKDYSHITNKFKNDQEAFKTQIEQYNRLSEEVAIKERRNAEIVEKINGVRRRIAEIDERDDDKTKDQFKEVSEKLGKEMGSLDVKIGILNHTLLRHKLHMKSYEVTTQEGLDQDLFDEIV